MAKLAKFGAAGEGELRPKGKSEVGNAGRAPDKQSQACAGNKESRGVVGGSGFKDWDLERGISAKYFITVCMDFHFLLSAKSCFWLI